MSDIEHLHHVLDTAKCVVSIVLNGMLGFLILKYSTGHLSAYKKVLGMTCLADILLSSAVLLSQPVIFYAPDGAMVLVSNGFFADRSAFVDHLVMSMWCMSVHSNVVCLVAQFLIRYRTMCKQNDIFDLWKCLYFAIPWCATQALVALWNFSFDQSEETRALGIRYLDQFNWHYAAQQKPYPTVSTGVKVVVHHGFYFATCLGGYALIVWSQYKIYAYLNNQGQAMLSTTRRMHAQVNRALIALAAAPLVASFGPILTIIGINVAGKSASAVAFSYITLLCTSITLVNPITTALLVRQYREALFSFVKANRHTVTPMSSTCDNLSDGVRISAHCENTLSVVHRA